MNKIPLPGVVETDGLGKIKKPNNSNIKQIGCKGEDARFIKCSGCLHLHNSGKCYKARKEGNLVVVFG